jgi:hypothetical protein
MDQKVEGTGLKVKFHTLHFILHTFSTRLHSHSSAYVYRMIFSIIGREIAKKSNCPIKTKAS